MGVNKKWDIEDAVLNRKAIDEIIARIQEIDDPETVGMIAAQDILDIVNENVAPLFYNKGIEDARKAIQNKVQDIEMDLDILKQS